MHQRFHFKKTRTNFSCDSTVVSPSHGDYVVVLGEGPRHELTEITESNYTDLQPPAGRRPVATRLAKRSHRTANRRYHLGLFQDESIGGGGGLGPTNLRIKTLPSYTNFPCYCHALSVLKVLCTKVLNNKTHSTSLQDTVSRGWSSSVFTPQSLLFRSSTTMHQETNQELECNTAHATNQRVKRSRAPYLNFK